VQTVEVIKFSRYGTLVTPTNLTNVQQFFGDLTKFFILL